MQLLGQHVDARLNFMCGSPVKPGDESFPRLMTVTEDESLHREVRTCLTLKTITPTTKPYTLAMRG